MTLSSFLWVLDIPFELRNAFNTIRYRSDLKIHVFEGPHLPQELYPYRAQPFSYEAWIERFLNQGHWHPELQRAWPTQNTMTPRVYQNEAFHAFNASQQQGWSDFLLADAVGLGKTISAAMIARQPQFQSVLVVTTLSAVAHWRHVFLQWTWTHPQILILNYDRLQKLFAPVDETAYKTKAKTKRVKNKRLAKKGGAPHFDLVIWDESHKLKNQQSLRSQLARRIQQEATCNLYLSATAGQNPLELSYLSGLLAQITGHRVKDLEDFETWCQTMDLGVTRGAFGQWKWNGSELDLEKVRHWLFDSGAALRRRPQDIAGYPEINRIVQPCELDGLAQQQYLQAWSDFQRQWKAIRDLKDIRKDIRIKNQSTHLQSKTHSEKLSPLVAQLRFRQKASLLKLNSTTQMALDLLENGHQVAISVNFKETLTALRSAIEKQGYPCAVIDGSQDALSKEKERLSFQKGERLVVLFTVEEAISLHQGEHNQTPRSMLIHDLRWSAISMSQIEGRTHRDGQFSQIYWMVSKDTIEWDIAQIVLSKMIHMGTMIGDDTQVLRDIEQLL